MDLSSSLILSVQGVSRPTATYHPDVWGDQFLVNNVSHHTQIKEVNNDHVIQELVEEIRRKVKLIDKASVEQLQLIDSIERLGIAYHFELEIEQALRIVFKTYEANLLVNFNDIFSVALSFRLLRQHGYRVSCDIFEKFKDAKGRFNDNIASDVKGMLEFFEATHLSVHGEDILDEGLKFTRYHLKAKLGSEDHNIVTPLVEQITHALKQPHRRGKTRLEMRGYISIYEQDPSHNKTLLRLAKLDFNRLQSMHKLELAELCRWWKGLNVQKELPFVRDRVVEGYFWILGIYYEPQYVLARKILARVFSVTSIIDDIYDAYGTFEELQIFTAAIERWSYECLDKLPRYMKTCYKALLEVYENIEEEMIKHGKMYRMDYAKEVIKILARAYLDEIKWRENNCIPTMNEYMNVATQSCGFRSLIITSFLGMGDAATKEHFQWVLENPLPVRASSIICRLKDDIVGREFEQQRKHIASAVDCYMKEHNATKEETINEFDKRIEAAWKDLNESFLLPTIVPSTLLYRVLNFARVMEVVYKEGDWYTHVGPEMQSYIKKILIDPIPEQAACFSP